MVSAILQQVMRVRSDFPTMPLLDVAKVAASVLEVKVGITIGHVAVEDDVLLFGVHCMAIGISPETGTAHCLSLCYPGTRISIVRHSDAAYTASFSPIHPTGEDN